MTPIEKKLQEIKKTKKIGLMAHVVVGYPSVDATVEIVRTMADSGVDFIELQIPFSDPIADGPTIMQASQKALENGTKVSDAFLVMKQLSSALSIPLLFMCYYNTVFAYGVEKFCKDAKAAGADGLIVPDMPLDEEGQEHFFALCKKYDLHTIQVISPASTSDRLEKNAKAANGFVYCTAHQGITGAKDRLDPTITSYLQTVKKNFSMPIAVGFGISKKEHIVQLIGLADVAVVGSAVIDVIASSAKDKLQGNIRRFFTELMIQ